MTLFEKIARREIPSEIVLEEEDFLAFHDTNPQAPVHVLIMPNECIPRVGEAEALATPICSGGCWSLRKKSRASSAFLKAATDWSSTMAAIPAKSVPHLHIHLLAKRKLDWPPG